MCFDTCTKYNWHYPHKSNRCTVWEGYYLSQVQNIAFEIPRKFNILATEAQMKGRYIDCVINVCLYIEQGGEIC